MCCLFASIKRKPKPEQGTFLEGHCSSTHWKTFVNVKETKSRDERFKPTPTSAMCFAQGVKTN